MLYMLVFFSYLLGAEKYHNVGAISDIIKSNEVSKKKASMETIIDIYSSGIAQFLNPDDLVMMLKNDNYNNFSNEEIIIIKTNIIKRRESNANLQDIF